MRQTTIARNATRKIADIQDRVTRCVVYTLENYYRGEDVDQANAWDALATYSFAKLHRIERDGDRPSYWEVYLHSRRYYYLYED